MDEAELRHLRRAIELSATARSNGNHPFGALLVGPQGNVLAEAENTVVSSRDVTAHAELNLVRIATSKYMPAQLARCTLFTSTEPCAMCAGVIYWAGIGRVVYALSEQGLYLQTTQEQAREAMKIPSREVFARCGRAVKVEGPALEDEASKPHEGFWDAL